MRDVVIVGGGPAGLAAAIAAARHGVDVLLLERRALPADKACGEGILPGGVRALAALGALERLPAGDVAPLSAIRWINGASMAEASLPPPGGLGVRRTALSAALLGLARSVGVEVREGVTVLGHVRSSDAVRVATPDGTIEARLLVGADGLRSQVAARERLGRVLRRPRRFGLRQHFRCVPWSSAVEVHLGDGLEAYVTPSGPDRVGVALLCEGRPRAGFEALLERFPALTTRLEGSVAVSRAMGAGPFPSGVRARTLDRLVLLGDAAGYEDAITGDGLSLALASAVALGPVLPAALAAGAPRHAFARWERGCAARYRRYLVATRAVLALVRRPGLRGGAIRFLGAHRTLLEGLVGLSAR